LMFLIFETNIKKTLNLLLLRQAIEIGPFNATLCTGYVNTHCHASGNNTGIFPGAIYNKKGMKCNNGYISRKEDSAVK
ncbi:hypothetical protein J4U97_21345, partial [Escherichia coli]